MKQRLLNPGPINTTDSVKQAQIVDDICPREKEFGNLMQEVADSITSIVGNFEDHVTVLFTASGTGAVESILTSTVGETDGVIILANGAYGIRANEICKAYGIRTEFYDFNNKVLNYAVIETVIKNSKFGNVFVIHSETTNGILNDISKIGEFCRTYGKTFIVDAMSSFGAHDIDMKRDNISFLAASSNKNLQGLPGLSFVVCDKIKLLRHKKDTPRNFYFNLYKQYESQYKKGQMQFTPNVTCMYSLRKAIAEFFIEGRENRLARYKESWTTLINGMKRLNVKIYTPHEHASYIITSFYDIDSPEYNFKRMHDFLWDRGWTIYPGKINDNNTFRIANIGTLTKSDIEEFLIAFEEYLVSIHYK